MSSTGAHGRRLRVVVCGTTFGQFYLAALANLPDSFELAGILAKGSERSVDCARRAQVPLFAHPVEVPSGTDAACVVVRSGMMGGAGSDLACQFLSRGIHVVQEHPVHHDDIAKCLREAKPNGMQYRLGNLYVQLPSVRRFVAAAKALLEHHPPLYVDAACSVQVIFPLLHALGNALGGVRPWKFGESSASGETGFSLLSGVICGIPLTLRVLNQVDPSDPDNHIDLFFRIRLGVDAGSLELTDTHGSVTWSPRLRIPNSVRRSFDFTDAEAVYLNEPSTARLDSSLSPTYRQILSALWPAAIGRDLLALRAAILGEQSIMAQGQHYLALSRIWQEVTDQLGYPTLRTAKTYRPLAISDLESAAAELD
jgi:thiazolinyl imide reductase